MVTKCKKNILTSRRIDTITEWLDNEADMNDVNDLFVHIWPVDCDMDSQGMVTCSAKSEEKCLECLHNANLPESWRINDNYISF